ncbi:MAG TPA: hypothetical protein VE219_05280 [Candidatus Sulfotelmatobacter sp.]|nr:hypothetical protein [Candidatus Sulfotelmatobacter sp.]
MSQLELGKGENRVHLGIPIATTVVSAIAITLSAIVLGVDWYLIPLLAILAAVFIGGCSIAFAFDMARSGEDNPTDK